MNTIVVAMCTWAQRYCRRTQQSWYYFSPFYIVGARIVQIGKEANMELK